MTDSGRDTIQLGDVGGDTASPDTAAEGSGPMGFYVTLRRGSGPGEEPRTAFLLGPYGTKDEAESKVWRGRKLAPTVDSRAAFDAYGVTTATMPPGAALPEGKLNALLADTERGERCWPTPEADTYLRRIRNQDKAGYAWAVWEALCLDEPPPAAPAGLSATAAQEVELRLAELVVAKRNPAPCQARFGPSAAYPAGGTCGQPATDHVRHGPQGHTYVPPEGGDQAGELAGAVNDPRATGPAAKVSMRAAPAIGGAKARRPARQRPGQQIQPPTRGRSQ